MVLELTMSSDDERIGQAVRRLTEKKAAMAAKVEEAERVSEICAAVAKLISSGKLPDGIDLEREWLTYPQLLALHDSFDQARNQLQNAEDECRRLNIPTR